jgi:hypothetical protein
MPAAADKDVIMADSQSDETSTTKCCYCSVQCSFG